MSIERAARSLCVSYIFAASAFGIYAGLKTHPEIAQQMHDAVANGDTATFAKLFTVTRDRWRDSWDIAIQMPPAPSGGARIEPHVLPPTPELRGQSNEIALREPITSKTDTGETDTGDAAAGETGGTTPLAPEARALQSQSFSPVPLDFPQPDIAPDVRLPRMAPIFPEQPKSESLKSEPAAPKRPRHPPAPPPADENLPADADIARVQDRLRNVVSDTLYKNFDLYLYVSKADHGPWAQHMYVFAKQKTSNDWSLKLLHVWPVSTGRDAYEVFRGHRTDSFTPDGLFELDPARMFVQYHSVHWDEEMPYSMFFNWTHDGDQTGVAIHAATKHDVGNLGKRASAGCVRLPPKEARYLYNLVRQNYRGAMPSFKVDKNGTMSKDGKVARHKNGDIARVNGYRVLVMIENYGGGEETEVSALY